MARTPENMRDTGYFDVIANRRGKVMRLAIENAAQHQILVAAQEQEERNKAAGIDPHEETRDEEIIKNEFVFRPSVSEFHRQK